MKEQTTDHSKFEEVDSLKYRKRAYRDEDQYERVIFNQKKRNSSENHVGVANMRFGISNGDGDQDDETLIRETQAALKSLSGSWSETNAPVHRKTSETDECPAFQNLFDEKNGTRKATMAGTMTTETFNANLMATMPPSYRPHSASKPGLKDVKYESYDFDEIIANNGVDDGNSKEIKGDSKQEPNSNNTLYQTNQATALFSQQNSAFRPPSYDNKKGPFVSTIPYSTYHFNTESSGGYSSYPVEMNSSANAERELAFQKPFGKENEDANVCDSKQYTTLQPAGVGSKAASVMQEIAREGVVSVSAVSSANNSDAQNSSSVSVGRPLAAFSPGSSNKGKHVSLPSTNAFAARL